MLGYANYNLTRIVPSLASARNAVCTYNGCFTSLYYIDRKLVIKFANRYLRNLQIEYLTTSSSKKKLCYK